MNMYILKTATISRDDTELVHELVSGRDLRAALEPKQAGTAFGF